MFSKCSLRFSILFWGISIIVFSCSSPSNRTPEQEDLLSQINTLSKEVYQNEKPIDIPKGEELLKYLTQYTNAYREDSMSAVFLLDGAQLAASMGKYQKAIVLLS